MTFRSSCTAALLVFAVLGVSTGEREKKKDFRGALISVRQADSASLHELRKQQYNVVVLELGSAQNQSALKPAQRTRKAGFALYYWIEVGRCPELADSHPEWMASLQGHPEWRRIYPKFPKPAENEVVKNYPWIPITYRESFDAHLKRVWELLRPLPKPDGIFLNDLQAAPSACGCGNTLCRWTTDYGPIKTATPLGPDSAAKFVMRVKQISPDTEVIPVWLTECQEHESKKGAACDGVSCFGGLCWTEWTNQLMPLAESTLRIAALSTHKNLSLPESWIESGISAFEKMPPLRNGKAIKSRRLISVVQGWNCSAEERTRYAKRAIAAGAQGTVTALTPIDQSWTPRIVNVKPR